MNKAFCILAAGKGTRLNEFSNIHKTLLPINNKAVLSFIIEKSPISDIIIAVGHQKELIKEYCLSAHTDKNFTFVEIDNYDGEGSGPGYSLHCCKEYLQKPFYLTCSDTIVFEELPDLNENWLGISPIIDPEKWATVEIKNDEIINFKNKSKDGFNNAFIGIFGIKDYEIFWKELRATKEKEYEMVSAFYNPQMYPKLKAINFTWFDIGTTDNYLKTKKRLTKESPCGMEKEINEITYKYNKKCIKLFKDSNIAKNRIKRASNLQNLIPKLDFKGNYVYSYDWINGNTLYEEDLLIELLNWCKDHLWIKTNNKLSAFQFYCNKTYSRYQAYLDKKGIKDSPLVINGKKCQTMESYLDEIDWNWLSDGISVQFHGDLQFDNIIHDGNRFWLIDWRDSFGNSIESGDLYYDFAKLLAGLKMPFNKMKTNQFNITIGNEVRFSFEREDKLIKMEENYKKWIKENGFNWDKVNLLGILVYLNMASLHVSPFDDLLFNFSKLLLEEYDTVS